MNDKEVVFILVPISSPRSLSAIVTCLTSVSCPSGCQGRGCQGQRRSHCAGWRDSLVVSVLD